MARKSYQASRYRKTICSVVMWPSELVVWVCTFPLNHLPSASKGLSKTRLIVDQIERLGNLYIVLHLPEMEPSL